MTCRLYRLLLRNPTAFLWRLRRCQATAVLASPALAKLATDENARHRWEWLRRIEFAEVSRILVSVAAIVRNGLETAPRSSIELERPVGILIPDQRKPDTYEALTFRESCNKILHAVHVDPEVKSIDDENIAPVLEPRLSLHGEFRRREWKAVLDIREFVLAAVVLT
jgi:hypothetical protein